MADDLEQLERDLEGDLRWTMLALGQKETNAPAKAIAEVLRDQGFGLVHVTVNDAPFTDEPVRFVLELHASKADTPMMRIKARRVTAALERVLNRIIEVRTVKVYMPPYGLTPAAEAVYRMGGVAALMSYEVGGDGS